MSFTELVHNLTKRDLKLSSEGGFLKIIGERGRLTPELQESIRRHKTEILRWLETFRHSDSEDSLPVIKTDREGDLDPFPMSDLQSGFYLANDPFMEYHVRPHYYAEKDYYDFQIDRFENAWTRAFRRHKRELVLVTSSGQLQALREDPVVKCHLHDLRSVPVQAAFEFMLRTRDRLMRKELPLDKWPFFDLEVSLWVEGGVEKARVHYNNNNFFFDGVGSNLLWAEVERYYHEPAVTKPDMEISYRDAVLALIRLEESEIGRRSRVYWESRLPDFPPPPELPQVHGMERRCRSRLQRRELVLPFETWQGFKKNASKYGLTSSNAIICAYAEVISVWSGSQYFILSNMMTRRLPLHSQIKEVLGNFATLYPLEVDLREPTPFWKRAIRLQEQVLRDANNRYWGGMKVMQALNRLKGEPGRAPCPFVVGSGIVMERFPKFDFSCLETSQTLLDHQFWELSDGSFYAVWDLLEEFFPPGLIDAMWRGFRNFLVRLGRDEQLWERVVIDVVTYTDLARRIDRNRTCVPIPQGRLEDRLSAQAALQADRPALIRNSGNVSYGDLFNRSRNMSITLHAKGISAGQRVAILAEKGLDLMVAAFGILGAGGTYVPLDPSLPADRIRYMLRNCEAKLAVTQSKFSSSDAWPAGLDLVFADATEAYSSPGGPFEYGGLKSAEDLAYIIYTSGSTGEPKGVMIDHRGALNTIADINNRYGVCSDDVLFGVSSFGFDLSVYDLFGSVEVGASLVYPDPESGLNPAHWLEMVLLHKVTVWNSVPALMSLLAEAAERQGVIMDSIRLVLLSGDWIPVDLPAAIRKVCPNARLVSLGGATEASIWSIYYDIDSVDPRWISIPYGYPLANQTWEVRDPQGRPAPVWTPGELCIGGIGLAKGYLGDPERTAERFPVDPATGEQFYRTGDRGRYLPDGCIEFLGRIDSQVKIQGHRIELGEVEAALLEHSAVKAAVVSVSTAGATSVKQLVAYVVLGDNAPNFPEALEDYLREKLPGYMVPTAWALIENLPLTRNGKVDRSALAKIDPISRAAGPSSAIYVAPRNRVESELVEVWSGVLKRTGVGIRDDFFDLGGQSFDAVRILGIIKEKFGKSLSLGEIFQGRNIESLAAILLSGEADIPAKCLVPVLIDRPGRPYFFVHPAGGHALCYLELARRLDRPVFGFQAHGVDGKADPIAEVALMAEKYLEELRQVQPTGPYSLGGWSSGAMIAYEMVTQLERAGETVDLLISVDGPTPFPQEDLCDEKLLLWFLEDLALGLPLSILGSQKWDGMSADEMLFKALRLLRREAGPELDPEQLAPIFRVFRSVVRAGSHYTLGIVHADILALRASDGVVSEFVKHPHQNRADWGWSLYTTGNGLSETLPGTHHTLLTPPFVDAVAEHIVNLGRSGRIVSLPASN